jgi:putative two-component system response regulator
MATSTPAVFSDAEILGAPILIVDDHPVNVRLLEVTLRREGYTGVVSTTDPDDVGRLSQQLQPALILLDLRMPGRSGFDILEELRQATPDQALPVLVLTSDASMETHQRARAAGARAVLAKPFERLTLLHYVRTLLHVSLLERQTRDQSPARRRRARRTRSTTTATEGRPR